MNKTVLEVTRRISERSAPHRDNYLAKIDQASETEPSRNRLGCSNLAHGIAGCSAEDKSTLASTQSPNLAIVTAYNDMLSAHRPYENYPEIIRSAATIYGATAHTNMIRGLGKSSPRT